MILDPHMLLQFPQGTEAHTRLKRLIGMEIVEPQTIDWSILATLGATERATTIIGASGPWRRMMEMGGLPAYREIVLEFLSTFEFHPPQAGGVEALEQLRAVSFTLCGQDVEMSLTQWGIATGFYTRDEVTTPLFLDASLEEDEARPHRLVAADQDPADQPPPSPHHVVVRQPRLHPTNAAILRDLLGSVRDLSGLVDRLEGMMRWMMERMAASAGMDVPVFPGPGPHQDPQDPGGHA
ncbi:hypothetical protein R6Q59_021943 [Mikania micrantha]